MKTAETSMNMSAIITMANWQQVAIVILQCFSLDKISQIFKIYDSRFDFFAGQYNYAIDIPDHNGKVFLDKTKLFIFISKDKQNPWPHSNLLTVGLFLSCVFQDSSHRHTFPRPCEKRNMLYILATV